MRTINFSFYIISFIILFTSCSSNNNSDLRQTNLKGNVKSVEELLYNATEKDGDITKGEQINLKYTSYNRDGNLIKFFDKQSDINIIFRYDSKGNKIEEKDYYTSKGNLKSKVSIKNNSDGKKIEESYFNPQGGLYAKNIFRYDSKGNKIEVIESNSEESPSSKDLFKYNDKGYLIEELHYNSEGNLSTRYTYKYDINNLIESNWYKGDGKLDMKIINKYDSKGNKIEDKTYDSKGNITSTETFIYNDNRKIIERKNKDFIDSIYLKYIYKYDSIGNIIEKTLYNLNGVIELKWNYKYEYDKIGNWIKMISLRNDIPFEITERKIIYY